MPDERENRFPFAHVLVLSSLAFTSERTPVRIRILLRPRSSYNGDGSWPEPGAAQIRGEVRQDDLYDLMVNLADRAASVLNAFRVERGDECSGPVLTLIIRSEP